LTPRGPSAYKIATHWMSGFNATRTSRGQPGASRTTRTGG
jgi:hypothetical protein